MAVLWCFAPDPVKAGVGIRGMILPRAFIREVLVTSSAVTLVIVMIFLVVRALGFLSQAAEGLIPIDSIFLLLLLKVMTYMDVIFPLMLFLAILMVLERWNRDNETLIMLTAGFGPGYLLKPTLFLLLIGAILVGGFSFYFSPLSVRVGGAIEHDFRNSNEISGIVPGVFMETRNGQGVYFVQRVDRETSLYEHVFAYGSNAGQDGVIIATRAKQQFGENGDRFLVLENGVRYEGVPGESAYRVIEFESYILRLKLGLIPEPPLPLRGWANRDLWVEYGNYGGLARSELHWRLSKVVVLPVLILFALSLGQMGSRGKRLPALFTALVVYFCYTNFTSLAVAAMRRSESEFSPVLGLWTVHGVFALLAVYLFWCRANNRPFLSLTFRPVGN